jgi:histone deacetylase complex regulatory component SIN3
MLSHYTNFLIASPDASTAPSALTTADMVCHGRPYDDEHSQGMDVDGPDDSDSTIPLDDDQPTEAAQEQKRSDSPDPHARAAAVGPTGENPGQAGPQPQDGMVGEALAYLNFLRLVFQEQPEKYDEFLGLVRMLKELHSQGVTARDPVLSDIVHLFNGRGPLLQGFSAFLDHDDQASLARIVEQHVLNEETAQFLFSMENLGQEDQSESTHESNDSE